LFRSLAALQFFPASIEAQLIRFEPVVADGNEHTLEAFAGFVRAQQNARIARAGTAELKIETGVLQRMIGDEPAWALLPVRFSGKLPIGGAPLRLPKRVPLVQTRSFKRRIRN